LGAIVCPMCLGNDVYASHRRGLLERGPLTWVGLLPFRCSQCQKRFFRFALRDPRRRHRDEVNPPGMDRPRPPRWNAGGRATLTLCGPGQAGSVIQGTVENASLMGMRVRLPVALEEGSEVIVAPEREAPHRGTVRWRRPKEEGGILHGIQFNIPVKQHTAYAKSLRRARIRQALRRSLMILIGVLLMAVAAYGLVWLLEAMRQYDPKYYEPKDIERYQYQGGQGPPKETWRP
jgi:hypothetical protein